MAPGADYTEQFIRRCAIGALATMIGLFGFLVAVMVTSGPSEAEIEKARFMIECSYDWDLSPKQCESILRGEDPPKNPWADEPGC